MQYGFIDSPNLFHDDKIRSPTTKLFDFNCNTSVGILIGGLPLQIKSYIALTGPIFVESIIPFTKKDLTGERIKNRRIKTVEHECSEQGRPDYIMVS